MAFEIPQDQQQRSHYVQSRFSEIAGRYDLFNDLITQGFHRLWKRHVVQQTCLAPGGKVLDICCGTGDITERLEAKVGPQGQVVGLDFSWGMLQVARSRAGSQAIRRFMQGNAMQLPFADQSFDAVTVGYGLRNLVNLQLGLDEVHRVLKPGGKFVSLDMGKVKLPLAKQLFNAYFFHVVPTVGKLLYPGQDMFDYFPQSSVEYPSQERLQEILLERGFAQVSFKNFHLGGTTVHVATKHQAT